VACGQRTAGRGVTPEKFWSNVSKTDTCWIWTGDLNSMGYGRYREHNQRVLSHRIAWTLVRGLIPPGLCILHRCDVKLCVNPDHLFLGTLSDNAQDMIEKGRGNFQLRPETRPRGANHPNHLRPERLTRGSRRYNAIFSEDEVRRIRTFPPSVGTAAIARVVGKNYHSVWSIRRGKGWKHVAGVAPVTA
jgi:hypothetical protein